MKKVYIKINDAVQADPQVSHACDSQQRQTNELAWKLESRSKKPLLLLLAPFQSALQPAVAPDLRDVRPPLRVTLQAARHE